VLRNHALVTVSVVSIAILGCEGSSSTPSAAGASASSTATSQALSVAPSAAAPKPRSKFARHGGIGSSLFRATHDLDLPQGQQNALDKIESALKADDEGIRTTMKTFRADLITGVRAAKLDTAKLTADDSVVDTAIADHQSKEVEALDSLHLLLDATQRATIVASIRAKQGEHESRMIGWMRANEADGGAPDWNRKRLDRLASDLALEPGQQKQVAAILAKAGGPPNASAMQLRWEERKQRADALLTAFASDTFDAKKLDLSILPGKTAHEAMDRMVTFFTQILPTLHPDQRDRLAAALVRPFGGGDHAGMPGPAPARGPVDDFAFPFAEPVETEEQPGSPH
jgi:Spy/CpxP family protein refolding chaperone